MICNSIWLKNEIKYESVNPDELSALVYEKKSCELNSCVIRNFFKVSKSMERQSCSLTFPGFLGHIRIDDGLLNASSHLFPFTPQFFCFRSFKSSHVT